MKVVLNMNFSASVVLTESGARVQNTRHAEIARQTGGQVRIPNVEAGDTIERELWALMETFGPHFYMGADEVPFDSNMVTVTIPDGWQG